MLAVSKGTVGDGKLFDASKRVDVLHLMGYICSLFLSLVLSCYPFVGNGFSLALLCLYTLKRRSFFFCSGDVVLL